MYINIQVIAVEVLNKGTYQCAEVTYKQLDGTKAGQTQSQKVMSFASPVVFSTVKTATQGQVFQIEMEKNDKGYWQWNKAAPGSADNVQTAPSAQTSTNATARATPVVKSTYETTEERALRQTLIVRQSSLSNAITLLTTGAKQPPSRETVFEEAQAMIDFVYQNNIKMSDATGFDQMESDEIV